MTYYCIKKKFGIEFKPNSQPPQEIALYEPVNLSNKTITKDGFELQPNPAYGTNYKVIMDTNPAYESCKLLETIMFSTEYTQSYTVYVVMSYCMSSYFMYVAIYGYE